MENKGRILIADDEKTFLQSTADLLRIEGYTCECAKDALATYDLLKTQQFDLLIADIKMPGNHHLELIKEISGKADHLSVILVTGYPNVNTAIDAVNLSVSAYLVKPFACEELFSCVENAMIKSEEYRKTQEILQTKMQQLETTLQDFQHKSHHELINTSSSLYEFVSNNLLTISQSVIDLNRALNAISNRTSLTSDTCLTLACQRPQRLLRALQEAVNVLQKTKNFFKSKELAELRKNLEEIIKQESQVRS